MRKKVILTMGLMCLSLVSFAQGKRTVLSANIDGYQRDISLS